MLNPGDAAPLFTLPDVDSENFSLADLRGKRDVVLFFYPRSKAAACIRLIELLNDYESEFSKQNCVIIGISPEDNQTLAAFREEDGITLRLLSDASVQVFTQYGVWHEKEVDGVRKMGSRRALFVIDQAGIIRYAEYDLDPHLHANEILGWVKQLRNT